MKNFIQDGKCLFGIVIPEKCNKDIREAANELVYAVTECCGTAPNVYTDGANPRSYCVHLGDTALSKSLGLKPSLEETGIDGFKIAVKEDNVFICAYASEGVIYGVYKFLEKTIGAEFFGYDEYVIPKYETAELPQEEIMEKPDIDTRVREVCYTIYDTKTERRWGFNTSNGREWVTWAHTHFNLIPKDKFWFTHRDFYSPDGTQLCLSNLALVPEMVKSVTARLTPERFEKSDVLFVMVGHEDVNTFCNCPRCEEQKKKYGGNSGVMMRFINAVADGVNTFVEEKYPDKIVKLITFGYGQTLLAPVTENENGTFSPVDDSVVAHKNVGVMLAPLGSDWAHSLVDKKYNEKTRTALLGWQAVKPELFIWTYDGIFDDSFIYMDNFARLSESYRIFYGCGATYLYDEGHQERGYPFLDMRSYIRGKLMWDLDADIDELVARFMKGYYKQAGDALFTYYQNLRAHFKGVEKEFEEKNIPYTQRSFVRAQRYYREKEFWDRGFLEENIRLLETCRAQLFDEGKNGALNRLEIEMLSPIYVLLEIYAQELSNSQVKYYADFFERVTTRNCIYYYGEHGSKDALHLTKKFVVWRSLLLREE